MLKLYLRPRHLRARFAHRAGGVRRALHDRDSWISRANQQNSPEYLAINPKGRVPSLVTDQGVLTETPAMLAFIAQSFPAAKLAPLDDAFAFAKMQAFNSYLCSTVHVAHAHKGRGPRWATRGIHFRRHEAQGAEIHGRLLFADRARHAEGAVGDGRAVHGLRSPICTRSRVGWRATASIWRRCRRSPTIASACRSGRRCKRCWPRRRPECKHGVVPALSRDLNRGTETSTHNPQGSCFCSRWSNSSHDRTKAGGYGCRLSQGRQLFRLARELKGRRYDKEFLSPKALIPPGPAGYSHVAKVNHGHDRLSVRPGPERRVGQAGRRRRFRGAGRADLPQSQDRGRSGGRHHGRYRQAQYYLVAEVDQAIVPKLRPIRDRYINIENPPASTFVVVSRLMRPGWMIEIEAIAALDA